MARVEGFWETELEGVVQRLRNGGAVRMVDHEGKEVIVRVETINPARIAELDSWA
ncbi:MAG TPA: hypothetical protein VI612_05175 [Candidatus Nanoarchaeia archaeon]|nr:hypothetical protein [Candidatus Nanoarchaeia archaeon]